MTCGGWQSDSPEKGKVTKSVVQSENVSAERSLLCFVICCQADKVDRSE